VKCSVSFSNRMSNNIRRYIDHIKFVPCMAFHLLHSCIFLWFHFFCYCIYGLCFVSFCLICKLCIFIIMFMYSYCYVYSILCILFYCFVLCMVSCVNV
jgi:hypothetical protein